MISVIVVFILSNSDLNVLKNTVLLGSTFNTYAYDLLEVEVYNTSGLL